MSIFEAQGTRPHLESRVSKSRGRGETCPRKINLSRRKILVIKHKTAKISPINLIGFSRSFLQQQVNFTFIFANLDFALAGT